MLFTKIALLLLGTIASVSIADSYPSLALADNFILTANYGLLDGTTDLNQNPNMATYASTGFKG